MVDQSPAAADAGCEDRNAWVIQTRLAAASRYNQWIHDLLDPHVGQRVVDAGCGLGNITRFFLDRELVVALDAREDFCAFMRDHFGDRGNLVVAQRDVADPGFSELAHHQPDTVMCANVLEHVEDDVAALRNFAEVLVPEGRVVLFTPALPCLHGTMDVADNHFRRYTPRSLREKLEKTGLEVEHQRWINPLGIIAWWLNGKLLRRQFVSATNYGLFDRLVPLLQAVERICPPPIGLSILTVGRKT